MFLSLWRAVELQDWVMPTVLMLFSLCAIWLEERLFAPIAQRIVLSLALLVQVILYAEHFSFAVANLAGILGAAYVWHEELLKHWRESPRAPRPWTEAAGEAASEGTRRWRRSMQFLRVHVHATQKKR